MGKNQDPEAGIRDKHPGSATLESFMFLSAECSLLRDEVRIWIRIGIQPKMLDP
jgi:hypothetical protein